MTLKEAKDGIIEDCRMNVSDYQEFAMACVREKLDTWDVQQIAQWYGLQAEDITED